MGQLFVIEGVDGSGKETQTKLLYERLKSEGKNPIRISFPDYESASSYAVKLYLDGQFGQNANDVNAKAASSFFALDRYISYKTKWEKRKFFWLCQEAWILRSVLLCLQKQLVHSLPVCLWITDFSEKVKVTRWKKHLKSGTST